MVSLMVTQSGKMEEDRFSKEGSKPVALITMQNIMSHLMTFLMAQ
jgi:hypothetical protein